MSNLIVKIESFHTRTRTKFDYIQYNNFMRYKNIIYIYIISII